jgi:hypothetical protein
VPDQLTSRPKRSPSWLRALLVSLVVVAAGVALGAAGYRVERSHRIQTPQVAKTNDGLLITAPASHELSGLGLNGRRLIWQDGASIEFLDLDKEKVLLLGPGPGMHTTWDPALGERYAVWFEAERQASLVAQAIAYDIESGRRWTLGDIGSVRSYPAISGDVAVWCSALQIGVPTISGVRVGSGDSFRVADGNGAPVVSGGLVVWAADWTGPFVAAEIASGATWSVAASLTSGRLTGIALSGRTLVWGQATEEDRSGVVAACDVDAGETVTLASGVSGLAGPSYDGSTVVWAERVGDAPQVPSYTGYRVMGRRPGGGPAFLIAQVANPVSEVAVSGEVVAWISSWSGGDFQIETARLPR